ncbi:adhesion G protein-coupled receptor E1-like isoform X3 [Gouania willdenowi]|uniref:adhesion G protein-coupled receptor E1-like isoform X3 n=1 Tax=Gouania willdenowi TaxID=441366 RepID=UPI001055D37C|nr:adhesion G protein-coupled receptor E1-like isoform X3 [Gouania willdenowi]
MSCCIFFLLYATLAVPVVFGYPSGSCDGYTNITESWRNWEYYGHISPGYPNDDAKLVGSWWRFTGIGGDIVVKGCVIAARGGTRATIYIPSSEYPPVELPYPKTATAFGRVNTYCNDVFMQVDIVRCPGGFYIYRPLNHKAPEMGYLTIHSTCRPDSCGPSAICTSLGGCICVPGRTLSSVFPPTQESFECEDIDECLDSICGPFATCTNIIESYSCVCIEGYEPTNPGFPIKYDNPCTDIDECITGFPCTGSSNTVCINSPGSYQCECIEGFAYEPHLDVCQDINECATPDFCGPSATCTNLIGSYRCECDPGYSPNNALLEASPTNNCIGFCDIYTNITESWRNWEYYGHISPGYPNDDAKLVGSWWRFTGIGGDIVVTECVIAGRGGTRSTISIPSSEYPPGELADPITATAYGHIDTSCTDVFMQVDIFRCPGGFYIYRPLNHKAPEMGYLTTHSTCRPDSCGPSAICTSFGGCICVPGRTLSSVFSPTQESFECEDIDECLVSICGPFANCTNIIESYSCVCIEGYEPTTSSLPIKYDNPCTDIDECITGFPCSGSSNTVCINSPGSFQCECIEGHEYEPQLDVCQDINECETPDFCYAGLTCINLVGSYRCECDPGYRLQNSLSEASPTNNCIDINECLEIPPICGQGNLCLNAEGTFHCFCGELFYPSTGLLWEEGITVCKSVQDILAETPPVEGQTKEKTFLLTMLDQLSENKNYLPPGKVNSFFAAATQAAGIGPQVESNTLGNHGDGVTGSIILAITELLVAGSNPSTVEPFTVTMNSSTLEMSLLTVNASMNRRPLSLSTTAQKMDIHLEHLDFDGFKPAAFLNLKGLGRLLSHEYFETENKTEMFADVFTAFLPMNTTNLTLPVNFTIYHDKKPPESGLATCVFWEDKRTNITENEKPGDIIHWSEEGCWLSYSDENLTVCSCSHLSTFALIMQIGEPPPESTFLEWLNRVCVAVGLFFFALAILTFLLCSWNPKINNTARLHLCLNLGLSHLLLLWNDKFVNDELACTVMAGILHFLVVASFMWMLLEAVQLYLLVRRLTKVQVIQKDGLPWPVLYLIGYGIPFVIIGVSALVYSDGYGPTEAGACWLSQKRSFNWALTGPVIAVLVLNFILFIATLWSLRQTLANMKSGASQSQDTKVIIFKIVAQFVILGCTWILGLYQTNIFFQVLFIILNSQQGTFLYIVHCLLNKEVREMYISWLSGSAFTKKGASEKDLPSVSEDIDKFAEKVSQ